MTRFPARSWCFLLVSSGLVASPLGAQVPVVSHGPLHPWPVAAGDTEVRAVELADVTGDGRTDVVTVGGVLLVAGQLTAHPGLGDGWLAPPVVTPTVGGPRDLGLADIDGDGLADALLAANGLTLQLATGGGAFGTGSFVAQFSAAVEVLPGDLDGDGDSDALLVGSAGTARTLLNQAGSLQTGVDTALGATVLIADQVALADLDLDGDLDLAVPDVDAHVLHLLPGDGTGGFGAAVLRPTTFGPRAVVAGAGPGDGGPELVVRGDLGVSCVWHENLGGLAFGPPQVLPGGPATSLVMADLDGNGWDELVRWSTPEGFLVSVDAGPFGAPSLTVPGLQAAGLRAAHMDGDGSLDVVAVNAGTGRVTVLRGDDLAAAEDTPTWSTSGAAWQAYADGTGDGLADLWSLSGDDLGLSPGNGVFGFGPARVASVAGLLDPQLALGDVDGDGRVDAVLFVDLGGGAPALVTASGAAIGPPVLGVSSALSGSLGPGARRLALADVDGDGLLDAVALAADAAPGQFTARVALGLGDGRFVEVGVWSLPGTPRDLAVGDVTGDGTPDTALLLEGEVHLLDGFGAVPVTPGTITTIGTVWDRLSLVDVDEDGRQDVVLARSTGSGVTGVRWHASLPGPTLGPGHPVGVSAPVADLTAVDLDRDGVAELVLAGASHDLLDVAALRGESAPLRLHREAGVLDLLTGDLDGNGLPEFVERRAGGVHAARVSNGGRAWLDLGAGLGVDGLAPPVLRLDGPSSAGSSNTLILEDAPVPPFPATASSLLVISLELLGAPFKGGVLVPDADLLLGPLPLTSSGAYHLGFSWPASSTIPSGTALYLQHWLPQGGGAFAASNAVQLWSP